MKMTMPMRGSVLAACLACGIGMASAEGNNNWNLVGNPVSLTATLQAGGSVEVAAKTTGVEHKPELTRGEKTVGFVLKNTGEEDLLGYNAGLRIMPDNLNGDGVPVMKGNYGSLLVDADLEGASGWESDSTTKGVYVYSGLLTPQSESKELAFKVHKDSVLLSGVYSMSVIGVIYHP